MIKKKLLKTLKSEEILELTADKKVYFIHANNPTTPYLEYQVINSSPSDFSEGEIQHINHMVQIDIFSTEDYSNIEDVIVNTMLENGFELNPGSPDLYEEKTRLYHKPLRFNIDLPTS